MCVSIYIYIIYVGVPCSFVLFRMFLFCAVYRDVVMLVVMLLDPND